MLIQRAMSKLLGVCAVSLLLGVAVQAQVPSRPKISDAIAWTSGGWVLLPFTPGSAVTFENGAHSRRQIFPPTGEARGNQWSVRDGELYFIGVNVDKNRVTLFRTDLDVPQDAWTDIGSFESTVHGLAPLYVYPLDEPNHYLGLHWMGGFTDRGNASFAAIFHTSERRFEFDGLVDMPFDGKPSTARFLPATRPGSKGAGECAALHQALEPTLWAPVATEHFAFLASSQGGILWAFSLKDGNCAKAINLGGLEWKSLPSALLVDHFILAAEPDRNGDLIVATRDPEVMTVAQVFQPNPALGKEAVAKSMSDFADAAKPFGGIRWWVVDGKTLEARPATGDRFPQIKGLDYRHVGRFKFLIDADGQIRTSLDGHWSEFLQQVSSSPPQEPKDPKTPKTGAADPK